MGVCGQIRLRDAVASALEHDCDGVDVKGLVSEEVPGDSAWAMGGW